jgi:mannan endo-1,4-beta-mannosidase
MGGRNSGGAPNNPSGGRSTQMGGRSSGGASAGGASGSNGTGGSSSGCTATGFHVQGGLLYDVKCNEFVLRGVNYPYAWYMSRNTQQDFAAIAATGANSVRLTMASGARWTKTTAANLTTLINAAKAAKLVTVVEVHDTTGYSEQSGSVPLSNATSYWTASDIANVLKGQEAYVIINIANEPNGNNTSTNWASSHVTAVGALRSAGFNHTLMVDAPNWGQDWQNTMRDGGGASIWTADTKKNLVFSVHMYDVFETSATVSNYFNTFLMRYEAPLVVGEFAADHGEAGNVDENAIMSFAESLGIGYLGWSWAGNSSDLGTLDITNNFNASSLTTWGNTLINGANGIKATSKPCTCFN